MKQTVVGNIKCYDISCSNEDIKETLDNLKINETTGMCYLSIRSINQIRSIITNLRQDIETYVKITLHYRKEIDRLNNIINELEKYLKSNFWNDNEGNESYQIEKYTTYYSVYNKLKELKESD